MKQNTKLKLQAHSISYKQHIFIILKHIDTMNPLMSNTS